MEEHKKKYSIVFKLDNYTTKELSTMEGDKMQTARSLESKEQAEMHRKERGDPEPEIKPGAFGKHHDVGGVGDFAGTFERRDRVIVYFMMLHCRRLLGSFFPFSPPSLSL